MEQHDNVAGSGREADAVIVFADIVGCSQISDALGLREYALFIDQFHRIARAAAGCVFHAPEYTQPNDYELSIRGDEACVIVHRAPSEDVQRAITFAVVLQLLWLGGDYNRKRLAKGASAVELGIGIHAGAVYIDKFQHPTPSSEGYAINVAKRIEGLSRQGETSKIVISSQAFAHIPEEECGLSFTTQTVDPTRIRGVRGLFVLRELVEIDESLVLRIGLSADLFDPKLLEHIAFVAKTRVDSAWLGVLWRIAYGVAHGQEKLFRYLFSKQTRETRNSATWFARAKREKEEGDSNMAAMMFEMSASSATGHGSLLSLPDESAWSLYNAALAHENRSAYASSIQFYQRAVCLKPTCVQYAMGLIVGYLRAGRATEARDFLYDVRDELLAPEEQAACLCLEAICNDVLNEAECAASCLAMLRQRFEVRDATPIPTAADLMTSGTDGGKLLLQAFNGVRVKH